MDLIIQNWIILLSLSFFVWLYSLIKKDVSIVDICWSLFFLVSLIFYLANGAPWTTKHWLVFILVITWSLRLSIYLFFRNRHKAEDRRYTAMRKNSPQFEFISLFKVFFLQATLATIIGSPLYIIANAQNSSVVDVLALLVVIFGLVFEIVADEQLRRFKSQPENQGKVLNKGLWATTRHPNYFGEAVVWWGIFLFAVTLPYGIFAALGPALLTFFLLKVSGVSMLEKDQKQRKPEYQSYIDSTPAFIPDLTKLKIQS